LVVENKIGIGTDDPKASSKLAISANTGVYSEVPDVYNQTLVIASNDAGIGLWSSKESDESSNIRLGEIDLDKGEMTDVWTIGRFANTNPTSSETVAPGSFRITYGTDLGYCHTPYFMIKKDGTVGIGTATPATGYKLDVEGKIQATGFDTGDITFRDQETDKILWRMFEDEDGLYLENMKTGKIFRFVLEEVIE